MSQQSTSANVGDAERMDVSLHLCFVVSIIVLFSHC